MTEEMKNCPADEVLACLIDGILGDKRSEKVKQHLAMCNKCKDVVETKKKAKQESDKKKK